jgi:hypothetical protein
MTDTSVRLGQGFPTHMLFYKIKICIISIFLSPPHTSEDSFISAFDVP